MRAFILLLALGLASVAHAKPRIALWVDGPRASLLQGTLYAASVNAVDLIDSDDLQPVIAGKPIADDLTVGAALGNGSGFDTYHAIVNQLAADALVMVHLEPQGKHNLMASFVVIGPSGERPLSVATRTLHGKGRVGFETFDFGPLRAMLLAVIKDIEQDKTTLALGNN